MRVAALISTGKDSTYAMQLASEEHDVIALGAVVPRRRDSWMFHRPSRALLGLFARATDRALVVRETGAAREEELGDLRFLLERLVELGVEGVVTGAVESEYQRSRVEELCGELGLESINPLWGREGPGLLRDMVDSGMHVVVVKVAAMGLGEEWLGREIDGETIAELVELNEKYGVHVAGEGGEYETLVLESPIFDGRLHVVESRVVESGSSSELVVKEARLVTS